MKSIIVFAVTPLPKNQFTICNLKFAILLYQFSKFYSMIFFLFSLHSLIF
jgi:hypothetical protein